MNRFILIWGFIHALAAALVSPPPLWAMGPMDKLLIIRIEGAAYERTAQSMSAELGEAFEMFEMIVRKDTTAASVGKKMEATVPRLVILMDNRAITLFKEYQASLPEGAPHVPSVSLMASFVDLAVKDLKNAAAISYEVPVVIGAVNLREVTGKPLERIGIVHRPFMDAFVRENARYCENERIELISHAVPDNGRLAPRLRKGLRKLVRKQSVDAVWVPNDNLLVNETLLKRVWIPFVKKYATPVIVGVEVLANPSFNFGTFAVVPDHAALGLQAAEMVYEMKENMWRVATGTVSPPGSVRKVLNRRLAERLFTIDEARIRNVDEIVR